MNIRSIFFDSSGVLRSGWRFLVFWIAFLIAVIVIGSAGAPALKSVGLSTEGPAVMILGGFLMLIPALLVGWLCGKYLEQLPFRALGAWFTEGWLRHLLLGVLFGAGTLSVAVGLAFASGGLEFTPNHVDTAALARSLGMSFAVFAVGAAWEEALFRGYPLQTFARSGLAPVAIALTAVFFGAIHTDNPSANTISTINTILAGIWFGIGYLKTRDLWFVWGMHVMWNWMQGAFFGIEVSGITSLVSVPLLSEVDHGPSWLTGETYGVEGGIVTTIAITVSTLVICFTPWLKPGQEMREVVTRPPHFKPSVS